MPSRTEGRPSRVERVSLSIKNATRALADAIKAVFELVAARFRGGANLVDALRELRNELKTIGVDLDDRSRMRMHGTGEDLGGITITENDCAVDRRFPLAGSGLARADRIGEATS